MAGRRRRLISPPAAEAEEVDRISHLADAIILHIFSFLSFKDVVKTSLLSKQWRLAWTSTQYIDLSLPRERPSISRALSGMYDLSLPWERPSIRRALSRCTVTEIEKFHLNAYIYDIYTFINPYPYWWIHFAVERRVKDASLSFRDRYDVIPRILCDCASLVSLRLSRGSFSANFTVHWPSLKKLCLHYVVLDNYKMIKILSGCPILESLTLHLWLGDRRIESRSLRELVIYATSIGSFDISAPNLLSLRLLGQFSSFRLNGVSSLAEAELNFNNGFFCYRLKFLLEQLQHVAKITIGNWCLKVLSAEEAKPTPHLSSRWRNIIVHTAVCKRDLQGIAYLLRSSPLLERLVICNPKSDKFKFKKKDFPKLCDFDEKRFWHSQKEFHCVANHLTRVEIIGFDFDNKKSKLLLALAKFLLEKAVGLKKMIIDVELRRKPHRGAPISPHDLLLLQEDCRRVSRNAEDIVNYRFNGLPIELCKHNQNDRWDPYVQLDVRCPPI